MSHTMTKEEREAFLGEPRVAILSIPEDGRGPQSSPVWYAYEPGGDVVFVTQDITRKAALLSAANGVRVSLTVQEATRPYRYVSVEGPVVSVEKGDLYRDLVPIAARYLDAADVQAFTDNMKASFEKTGRLKITVRPERWLSTDHRKR